MSIMPDVANGGIVIRDIFGDCTGASEAPNAYCPPETFLTTCQVTALAEDCTARITPAQINAIVSELMCFAVALDPNGPWDCDSNCNLSTMFTTFMNTFSAGTTVQTDGETIDGNGSAGAPITLLPQGAVAAICADVVARNALAACLISSDEGNQLVAGTDDRLYVPEPDATGEGDGTTITVSSPYSIIPVGVVEAICENEFAHNALALCLVSESEGNAIGISPTDGGLYAVSQPGTNPDGITIILNDGGDLSVISEGVVDAICGTPEARTDLAECLISDDADNQLAQGFDGGLYINIPIPANEGDGSTITEEGPFSVIAVGVSNSICEDDLAASILANCLISDDPGNIISLGEDGRLFSNGGGDAVGIQSGDPILVEIAFSRIGQFADTDILSGYVTATGFTLPALMAGYKAYVRNPSGNLTIYLAKNNVIVAQLLYNAGTTTWSTILAANNVFAVGDVLELRAGNNATFDLLAVTLVVRRPIQLA